MKIHAYVLPLILVSSCNYYPGVFDDLEAETVIYPDYKGITIPQNIAPLNFLISGEAEKYLTVISSESKNSKTRRVYSTKGKQFSVSIMKWKRILKEAEGADLNYEIFALSDGRWTRYEPFSIHVTEEKIDPYLLYRIIPPGFEMWGEMGIYQRDLRTFREKPLLLNRITGHNCINCHSFPSNNASTMLLHMRGSVSGTIISKDKELLKVNTKTDSTISAGVYPAWHPGGKYVAFSVNKITQAFHARFDKKIEVVDTLSDIIIYNTEDQLVTVPPQLSDPQMLETFPAWSPDGRYLLFCRASKLHLTGFEDIHYDLLRIEFDANNATFGKTDTLFNAGSDGRSVSFPRISPDGRYVMFCLSDYGNFSIWHDESDLYLLDLHDNKLIKPPINSSFSESYHSWSSNGRWVVFSSRRDDGLFTRPYISYFSENGMMHKPFILPQRRNTKYELLLKSYNIPELSASPSSISPGKIRSLLKSESVKTTFRTFKENFN